MLDICIKFTEIFMPNFVYLGLIITEISIFKQIDRRRDEQSDRHTERHTNRQTERQKGR